MTDSHLLGPESKDEWNEFAAACPGADILQSWEWGDLKGRSGWSPLRMAMRENGQIVAGMSLLKRRLPLGKSILYASRGPLLREWTPERLHDLLAEARTVARKHGAILLKVDPALADPNVTMMLHKEGFIPAGGTDGFGGTQPRCVMTLDITPSEEELKAKFKPKWRYNIRVAEKKGVTVKTECTRDDLPAFYDLLKITCARDGFLVRSLGYFEAMWDLLVPAGKGKLFLTHVEGQPVSGAFCTMFGPVCCYTYGASSNEHREKMPNHLMQWTMIQWAKAQGYGVYDFRGVSPKHVDPEHDKLAGLNRFKEGFGAEFVEYVGEYDLPLSSVLYPLWTEYMPKVRERLKRRKAVSETAQVAGD